MRPSPFPYHVLRFAGNYCTCHIQGTLDAAAKQGHLAWTGPPRPVPEEKGVTVELLRRWGYVGLYVPRQA